MTNIVDQPTHEQTTDEIVVPARRYVMGRYNVAVERLLTTGEASAHVVEALQSPTAEEFIEVYGPPKSGETMPAPEHFTFVGGLPGELLEIAVSWSLPRPGRKRAKRVPAPIVRVITVIEPASERVAAQCPVFGECGGCQLQHLSYPAQLTWKTARVQAALAQVGLTEALDVKTLPAVGCATPWHYRNHMRFSVNRQGQAGLTARGTHRVLPLTNCPIAEEHINDTLALLARHALPQPQVLIRHSQASNQLLLQPAPQAELREELTEMGLDVRDSDMVEYLAGVPFRIRPSSFFQTNTRQANRMAELVLALVPQRSDATWIDAYCGVGTFARLLAGQVGTVIAIEESASAIRDAAVNLNDVSNVELLQGKVEDVLPRMERQVDGLIIDPPRAGCQRQVLDALITHHLPQVIYISCNPDTLARDLAYLCIAQKAYRPISVQPLDMFPQTAHIETIALLEAIDATATH